MVLDHYRQRQWVHHRGVCRIVNVSLLRFFLLRNSPESIPRSVEPKIPLAVNDSVPGQVSEDFLGGIGAPHGLPADT